MSKPPPLRTSTMHAIGNTPLVQLQKIVPIHAFCGGVGTAGMLMGTAKVLHRANDATRIIALEPATLAVLSTGVVGTHHVEGIGTGIVPLL